LIRHFPDERGFMDRLLIDDGNFQDEIAASSGLFVIDFWAPWCGPCHVLAPTIERLADDYQGSVRVAKLNVDVSPMIASRFGVRSIPSVLFFQDGELVDTVVGVVPYAALAARIERHLKAATAGSRAAE
jgi:thioredoxin 1